MITARNATAHEGHLVTADVYHDDKRVGEIRLWDDEIFGVVLAEDAWCDDALYQWLLARCPDFLAMHRAVMTIIKAVDTAFATETHE